MGVLGSIMLAPRYLGQLAATLRTDEFFLPAHREIWDALIGMKGRGQSIDPVTLLDEVKARGKTAMLDGGEGYIATLACAAPLPEYVHAHAQVVSKNAAVRALRAACAEIAASCEGDPENAAVTLREASRLILGITLGRQAATETLAETGERVLYELEQASLGHVTPRVPTGIKDLDWLLGGGMKPGHLVVPCGLTSMGKSSIAFQIAFRNAAALKIPALLFSLEMGREETYVKGAASLARLDTRAFDPPEAGGKVPWDLVNEASFKASGLSHLVRVEQCRTIGQIVATATAWRAEFPGPRAVIVVDHIQKVTGVRQKGSNRQEEVWGVAKALKDLASDLKLPVIAPAQLDNDAAKENRAPKIGDIRDSKAIEHEADVVIGINRDRMEEAGDCELILLKHRGGKVGKATVQWVGAWQGFENQRTTGGDGYADRRVPDSE